MTLKWRAAKFSQMIAILSFKIIWENFSFHFVWSVPIFSQQKIACVAVVFLGGRASRDWAVITLAAILDMRVKGNLGREKNEGKWGGGEKKGKKQPALKLGFLISPSTEGWEIWLADFFYQSVSNHQSACSYKSQLRILFFMLCVPNWRMPRETLWVMWLTLLLIP